MYNSNGWDMVYSRHYHRSRAVCLFVNNPSLKLNTSRTYVFLMSWWGFVTNRIMEVDSGLRLSKHEKKPDYIHIYI